MLNPLQIIKSSQLCWKTCKKVFWQEDCVLYKITLHCAERQMSQILILSAYRNLNRKANKVSKCLISNHLCLEYSVCLVSEETCRVTNIFSIEDGSVNGRDLMMRQSFWSVGKENVADNFACIINYIKICSGLHIL